MSPTMNDETIKLPFAAKLFKILQDADDDEEVDVSSDIVSWLADGKSFRVHREEDFRDHVMRRYFLQNNYTSFTRQLYLYGFLKTASSKDSGTFHHPLFQRDDPEGSISIKRGQFQGDRRQSRKTDLRKMQCRSDLPTVSLQSLLSNTRPVVRAPRCVSITMREEGQGGSSKEEQDDIDTTYVYERILQIVDESLLVDSSNASIATSVELISPLAMFNQTGGEKRWGLGDLMSPRPIEEMIQHPLVPPPPFHKY